MHFGFFRRGINPFNREAMLEQMNLEVLDRLRLGAEASVLDMGCGLGATLRSIARRLPGARLEGFTLVPWQLEQGTLLNRQRPEGKSIRLGLGNYERTGLPSASYDAVCAIESSCYGAGSSKSAFLREAHRLLRPGGRIVVADGFIGAGKWHGPQQTIYRRLCDCWVIDTMADVRQFAAEMTNIGFQDIVIEQIQSRVTPSALQVPWVTIKFLVSEVLLGRHKMTRARWNNVLAPILLPFVGYPLGPVAYYLVSATRV